MPVVFESYRCVGAGKPPWVTVLAWRAHRRRGNSLPSSWRSLRRHQDYLEAGPPLHPLPRPRPWGPPASACWFRYRPTSPQWGSLQILRSPAVALSGSPRPPWALHARWPGRGTIDALASALFSSLDFCCVLAVSQALSTRAVLRLSTLPAVWSSPISSLSAVLTSALVSSIPENKRRETYPLWNRATCTSSATPTSDSKYRKSESAASIAAWACASVSTSIGMAQDYPRCEKPSTPTLDTLPDSTACRQGA